MKYKILLPYNENTKQVENEEKTRFVRSILEALGIPLDFWNAEELFSFETKLKLREVLDNFNILIVDDNDGGLKIYHERDLIAEWYKPLYTLKKDLSQINPKNKIYLEMQVSFQSIFDE